MITRRNSALLLAALAVCSAEAAADCKSPFAERAQAGHFVEQWARDWNRLDIDAVVAHLSPDARMRSPLAQHLTGQTEVQGKEAITRYWRSAYGSLSAPELQVDAFAWDPEICRLNIWWRAQTASGPTRASELMDFNNAGQIEYGEAFYGL
ncbi:nuclear transport factor 2 family protein [Halopseudomonas pachastrellae]|uniref:nuclear transport factor 2 family protein n=1 Tax=Halopseudomonas pachastrellae TaxID=254161 RepID=UPI003D7EDF12